MIDPRDKNQLTVNPQTATRKIRTDNAKSKINVDIDSDLIIALDAADSHEARIEILLLQIVRNTAP